MLEIDKLSDPELVASLKGLVVRGRRDLVVLLKHLNEFSRRELAESEGSPSLFEYCVRELRFSEGAAYRRTQSAKTARRFPIIFDMIESGELTLTSVVKLAPFLDASNHEKLLRDASCKTRDELDRLIATLSAPKPAKADKIRFIAPAKVVVPEALPLLEGGIASSVPEAAAQEARVEFKFQASQAMLKHFQRVQELFWHKNPRASCEDIFDAGLISYLERHDPARRIARKAARKARAKAPASSDARDIPQAVMDAVWLRDAGRCTFVSADRKRCRATKALEYDHIVPFALGGRSDDPSNVRLLCRAHNQMEARKAFGNAADYRQA